MKMEPNDEPNDREPKKLGEALRRLERERVFVPSKVDEAVLAQVREQFRQKKAEQTGIGLEAGKEEVIGLEAKAPDDGRHIDEHEAGSVATSVIGDYGLFRKKRVEVKVRRPMKPWQKWLPLAASIAIAAVMVQFARVGRLVPGDVNADGRVDVIDAMVLAQRVQSGETQRRWDVNGDRVVDGRDAEEILARAVDLERSGS
jgi:hypothetical protein